MTDNIKPGALKEGATIGVVSPSYWLDDDTLNKAINILQAQGYQILLGESVKAREDIFAGSPQCRADDIMSMFLNPAVDAIFCARGGYGANRVLPLLDYDLIRANPKIFMGFSDITAFLNTFNQRSGLICFHGPMLANYGRHPHDYVVNEMLHVLGGNTEVIVKDLPECAAKTLRAGEATGEIVGGNLSLIVERLGTDDQIDTCEKILLIEEVGEKLYAFDRMMLQLKNSGSLAQVSGLLFGEMTEMSDTDVPFGKSIDEIILDICDDVGVPIISNFPAGHGEYICTLPIGHSVRMVAQDNNNAVFIPESPVAQ